MANTTIAGSEVGVRERASVTTSLSQAHDQLERLSSSLHTIYEHLFGESVPQARDDDYISLEQRAELVAGQVIALADLSEMIQHRL